MSYTNEAEEIQYEWGYRDGYSQAYKEIERDSDYVNVTRCKDCKHAEPRKDMVNAYNCLKNLNPKRWTSHPCDYFCADGKRREAE